MLVEEFPFPDDDEKEVLDLIINDEVKYVSVESLSIMEDV
jgi:hypothetical protein